MFEEQFEHLLKHGKLISKSWLFSNTPNEASSSSVIYSIIQIAIANNLKPVHHLQYVFEQIQLKKKRQLKKIENILGTLTE